jgi:glycosyltransferase involved in cell wall biosynthesis
MCEPYYGEKVVAWPVGIDADRWAPNPGVAQDIDVLVYDKIRWRREQYEPELLNPIIEALSARRLRVARLRYGSYREEDFHALLPRVRSLLFLCEHETQGIAYQQALACGVPLFAWDRGGFWEDPEYYPHRVRFAPVSSVPYWDDRCGRRFADLNAFHRDFDTFWRSVLDGAFRPREFVLQHLTLERCTRQYLQLVDASHLIPSLPASISATA